MPRRKSKHSDDWGSDFPKRVFMSFSTVDPVDSDKLIHAIVASVTSVTESKWIPVEITTSRKALGLHVTSTTVEVVLISPNEGR